MLHSGGEAGNLVDYIYCINIFFYNKRGMDEQEKEYRICATEGGKSIYENIYIAYIQYIWERCRIIDRMRYDEMLKVLSGQMGSA